MKVLVINGSPKGETSITFHHIKYLETNFEDINFEYVHIAKLVNKIEDDLFFETIVNKMHFADLIVFAYPVYTLSIPYQFMVFMDKLQRIKPKGFDKLYGIQFSTSKHFFDTTAYDYMKVVVEDLDIKHLEGYTADMNEMLSVEGRKNLKTYFSSVMRKIEDNYIMEKRTFLKKELHTFTYQPISESHKEPSSILVIYNGKDYSDSLKNMITALTNLLSYQVHLLDLANYKISGGCIGCLNCAFTGHCVYPDDFEKMHREKILDADVVIYASDLVHHYFNIMFKALSDRTFYNGHRVPLKGKAVGYLINGSLSAEPALEQFMISHASAFQLNYLTPVTTERDDILKGIQQLCSDIEDHMINNQHAQDNFYSVGGMKIFRDLVYDTRGVMYLDHKYYKKHKLYDFPKKNLIKHFFVKRALKYMTHEKRHKKFAPKLNEYLLNDYKKVLVNKD